jgi:hypothetical protein
VRHSFLLSLLHKIVLLPSYLLVLLLRFIKWLVAPLALLPQLLIGVPLTLLRIRQPLRPRFMPLQEVDLPDAAWITLTDASETLAAEGFVVYGDFRCDELIQGAVLWLRFLGQPESGVGALAAQVEIKAGARPVRQFIEFSTEFRDGRVLDTNNLDLPYSLPAPAYLARVQLKDIWDPRALYALHRGLVASLPWKVSLDKVERAARDPAGLLADSYTREIQALVEQGWLRLDTDDRRVRLRPWAALVGVWRQAWPLGSLYLRAADRRSRRLLAEHGLDAGEFTGGAMTIQVSRQPMKTPTVIDTVLSGYEHVQPLAWQTDPRAMLEAVVVELDRDTTKTPIPREFRYSFRGHDDQPSRRIRRFRSFDILLDPVTGTLAVTAMEREFEQAINDTEWAELIATPPYAPLRLDPWLRDLDRVLPVAQVALAARAVAKDAVLDSASLYLDDERPCWQLVAWTDDETPLHVTLDARSGAILNR